ncbi:unnamed protein product [Clonostachys rosea f. rosea IK726]|uniref:Uncharacterized protein n=1 Tax=Clonostachys rosea f. rosea IK726 TaxID=1349383 RepID=A0ACA9U251_BIOOC|nr:unnamed protein product [Clonostachys rosea f. rosea IK726]
MGIPSQRLSQLAADGLMLMVYLSMSSALAVFFILIDLRGIIPRSIVYFSLGICFPAFALVGSGYILVCAFREESEKPSLTQLSLTLLLGLYHLIGAWIAFGLLLTSHFWPTDTLTPDRIWFLWVQAYLWPTVVIGLLKEHFRTQERKKALREAKEKALREAEKKALLEAEKKDPHEAEKPGEKDSIAEPVSGSCKSSSNL